MPSCNVYVLKEHNLIIFFPAKSGGSSFKKYFLEKLLGMNIKGLDKHATLKSIDQETDKYLIFQVGWKDNRMRDLLNEYRNFKKMIILRNPFKRFVSSFYSKLVTRENGECYFQAYFKNNEFTRIDDVTFTRFVERISAENMRDCHFIQQMNQVMLEIEFDYFINSEYLNDEMNPILKKHSLPDLTEHENRTSFARKIKDPCYDVTSITMQKQLEDGDKYHYKSFYNQDLIDKVKKVSPDTIQFILDNEAKFAHPIDFEGILD
jgi:Sulfotransferase family